MGRYIEILGGFGVVFRSGESDEITVNLDIHVFVFLFRWSCTVRILFGSHDI